MAKHLVVTADLARASLYCLDTDMEPGATRPPQLVELESFVNPTSRAKQGEVYSESRPGMQKGLIDGAYHGVSDHRNAHDDTFNRRFAETVMAAVERLAHELGASRIVLTAAPKMLGHLRAVPAGPRRNGTPLHEVAKDLTKLRPTELHSRLADDDLLPAPIRLTR
jgi:protein required for attachment to host cells